MAVDEKGVMGREGEGEIGSGKGIANFVAHYDSEVVSAKKPAVIQIKLWLFFTWKVFLSKV